MNSKDIVQAITTGQTALGIELGSTRIKAVLINNDYTPIAISSHDWENRLENGIWTYHLEDVWHGIQDCYSKLASGVFEKYGVNLSKLKSIGISAMMHGYLVFDKDGNQLAEFRTWRNTITERAAEELTDLFGFNIPQRWSIAHLYQAILNGEKHVHDIDFLTTLAGYVHWKLTGERVLGIGDASGVFPIDSNTNDYNMHMMELFNGKAASKDFTIKLKTILPRVLAAGESAGRLTYEGAKLLDPSGMLEPGIPLCPPEGDAGTGMVATGSVAERTGNVSAGTSIFTMIVLEKELSRIYTEIDMVTTPAGRPVAMVHCNTCTSDLDAWVALFHELVEKLGHDDSKSTLYNLLYQKALDGDPDCGGLINFNYFSGEPITKIDGGRPLFVRTPESKLTLANFMRAQLYSAIATLKIGMDILLEQENVHVDKLIGHGGFFKAKGVGQKLMSSALRVPVAVMETAGEGGPWGMALLAAYMTDKSLNETLESFLDNRVFAENKSIIAEPDAADAKGFEVFMERYKKCLAVEDMAVKVFQ